MTDAYVTDLIAGRRVSIVAPDLRMTEARAMMEQQGSDALLVVSNEGPCGVVWREAIGASSAAQTRVASMMEAAGPAIPANLRAAQARRVMQACGRSDLPVLSAGGDVVSLISMRDVSAA